MQTGHSGHLFTEPLQNDGRTALPPPDRLLQIERFLIDKFRGVAPNHLPAATLSATNAMIDWWPLMRHYGVPTRLLDWTASFFVAAYFATARDLDKDGAIYIVHAHTLNGAMRATHREAAELPSAISASDPIFQRADASHAIHLYGRKIALLDRMVTQQGVFMVNQNVGADIEDVLATEISKIADPQKLTLRKLIIPRSQKSIIMRRLRAMNVTASSLFPGLDGIGRHLEELVRNL